MWIIFIIIGVCIDLGPIIQGLRWKRTHGNPSSILLLPLLFYVIAISITHWELKGKLLAYLLAIVFHALSIYTVRRIRMHWEKYIRYRD